MRSQLSRAALVWLVIIAAETVHGTLRTLFLESVMGGPAARRVAVFTGSAIIFLVSCLFIRWIGARTPATLLAIGFLWVAATLTFEFVLGRFVIGLSWERLFSDYDIRNGGLMLFGLVFLLFAPLLAARARGIR